MTKVTAIVSPSARPRPSMTPPMTPTRVYGSTMLRTTSQVVQPRPYADSFSTGGTTSNTSRITDAMNGMTMIGEERRKHEQPPHAVDDRRDRRQQLDSGAERTPQHGGAHLGEEQRDAEAHRNADDQCDRGRDQRAVDRRERAELECYRIPDVGDEECEPELLKRGRRRVGERDHDAGEQHEHQDGEEPRRVLEQRVLPARGRR